MIEKYKIEGIKHNFLSRTVRHKQVSDYFIHITS